jgi:hypothetical protein
MAVNLRDAVSISDIDRELLSKLEIYCKNYLNASALFVRLTVNVWTLGHVVPVHTNKLFGKYNTGLGLNAMQGREGKHQRLGAYSKNTTVKNRWQQVFRHEYMTLIWLREQNPFRDDYSKSSYKYCMYLFDVAKTTFATVVFQKNVWNMSVRYALLVFTRRL